MEGGGRRVLSYSDAYAAPSGDVDLDAPLPSLNAPVPATTPAPSTSKRKQRATLSAEHQQHRQQNRSQPFHYQQPQHHQHVAYPQHHVPPGYPLQQPQPWYSGPPPPVHYPAPQPLPFPPPFAYQHAGPSSMPYGPMRPAPGVPFHDSRAFPQPIAPLPQTLQPRQDLQTPTPPWSRDRSPQPKPQPTRKPWPHSSLRAWNSVVIDDCDASSDEEDEQEAQSSDQDDGEVSPVRRTKTRIMARMTRCQTTAEFVALWRKLNGMEEGDDKRPPSSSGANGANAVDAGAVVSDSSISQAEYDKKQREINEMRDKIRRLEAAAQEKRRRQTEAAAAPTATPLSAPQVDVSQSEGTSAPQTGERVAMTTGNVDHAAAPSQVIAPDLAEQRARLLASMKQSKRKREEQRVTENQAEEATEDISEAPVTLAPAADPARASTSESPPPDPASDDGNRTSKSLKRQRKKQRRREEKEAKEKEALLAGGG